MAFHTPTIAGPVTMPKDLELQRKELAKDLAEDISMEPAVMDEAARRRAWNRANARKARQRRKIELEGLMGQVQAMEDSNAAILGEIRKHGLETAWLEARAVAVAGAPEPDTALTPAVSGESPAHHGFTSAAKRGKSVLPTTVVALTGAHMGGGHFTGGASAASTSNPASVTSTATSGVAGVAGSSPALPPASPALGMPTALGDTDRALLSSVTAAQTHFIITDPTRPDNPIVFASHGFYQLTGYSPAEIIGHNCRFMQGQHTNPATVSRLREAVCAGVDCRAIILNYSKTGVPFWNDLFVAALRNTEGRVVHFVGVQSNISEQRARAMLALLAPYDGVVTSGPLLAAPGSHADAATLTKAAPVPSGGGDAIVTEE